MTEAREVSPNGYSDAFGPNVANILKHGSRVIEGRVPAQVRKQLREAVKAGVLGHLPKAGLRPEIFFHPAHRGSATEVRDRHAAYSVQCIASVMHVKPVEQRVEEAIAGLTA